MKYNCVNFNGFFVDIFVMERKVDTRENKSNSLEKLIKNLRDKFVLYVSIEIRKYKKGDG